MGYPTLGEYLEALQLDPAVVLADPVLRSGTIRARAPGRPIVRGGTFAFTFEVATGAGKYALRCFHRELDSLELRYPAIQRHLAGKRNPPFVDFDFQPQGVKTESGDYPVVRMDWVEGEGLAAYVAQRRHDAQALQRLRLLLRQLARQLRETGIAHGDIQPSNIIVQDGGVLRLVDYDGMFVPELSPLLCAELGQRNFQHPGRRAFHYDAGLDAFSFAVLDFALQALCIRPDLWDRTASREDAFLLRAADYADPANSPTFALLAAEPALEQRTRDLASICVSPFERVPSFEDFVAGRDIPEVRVEFTGGTGAHARGAYLSPSRVLHAANFAQCCRHIGDRVELIGRVVRVAQGEAASDGRACLRLEFDERSRDRACVNIWPDALPRLDSVPDESWVGVWVSAVGLVEPIVRDSGGTRFQKSVSISISEPCQLQRLDEAEARYRLQAQGELTDRSRDRTGRVHTDPVTAQSALIVFPALQPVAPPQVKGGPVQRDTVRPKARTEVSRRESHLRRWLLPAAGAAAAALVAYFMVFSGEPERAAPAEPMPAERAVAAPSDSVVPDIARRPLVEPTRTVAPKPDISEPAEETLDVGLRAQKALKATDSQVETVAGTLRISRGPDDGCRKIVTLNGEAIDGLCGDVLAFRHRAVFGDRDVVVGFTRCSDAAARCDLDRPFWLEMRQGSPPVLRQVSSLWIGSGGTAVAASNAGVQVGLGTWNGERRRAMLTPVGNVVVTRTPVPARPLGRGDCAVVAQSLEACAASRNCSSFASSARPISPSQWSRLTRMYHELTGLDVGAFRTLCVRSCELGLTPSAGLIRRYACNGAEPGQWPAGDAAGGLER